MTQSLNLTQPQKAAAILVAMGKPAAGRLLKFFKQDELKALIDAARMLKTIPQADLERVVAEFEDEFAEGAGLLDSADTMQTLFSENLTPEEVSLLTGGKAPATGKDGVGPVWPELEKLGAEKLVEMLKNEHPQTIALVVSNLGPRASAQLVVGFDKPLRTEVVRRMLSINAVKPAAKALIERQMRNMLVAQAAGKDTSAGQARVANVLNELDKQQMDEMMRDLEESGAADVAAIRSRLFSFDDIVLLSQKSRVALLDGLATDRVTLALRNTSAELREAVLSALGARSRRMIEAELSAGGDNISEADIVAARRAIASAAVDLAGKGQVELPAAQAAA